MVSSKDFTQDLRIALGHLYEPDRLRENPLAQVFGVANQVNTFTRLQGILIDAIESLEPSPEAPAPAHAWETYEPLFYRYVKQLPQTQVAKQMGMSVRHFRRKEHAAIEVLAARLWEQHELSDRATSEQTASGNPRGNAATTLNGQGVPTVREELRWLRETMPEAPASLDDAIDEALSLLRPTLERAQVVVRTELPDDLPKLAVHSVALSQALLNLISVALRHTEGGVISLTAHRDEADVCIAIRLAGTQRCSADLPSDDRARLDLAMELAELAGGKLDATQQENALALQLHLPSIGQVPVVIIDDNSDTLQLLRRYAVDTRYQVITTQDPEKAIGLVESVKPSIVVLDVMMPGTDGWKLLGRLRQHPHIGTVPIIVCTVLPQQEIALDFGASGFLQKPVTRQAFLTALDDQLAGMA